MISYIKNIFIITALSMILPAASVFADDTVYGWQMMSEQERKEHREKMRSFKTEEERHRYRLEHHKKMEKRAQEQGKTLQHMREDGRGMGSGSGGKGFGGSGKGR